MEKKMENNDRLDDDGCDFENTLPVHLGAFILSNSETIILKIIGEVNGVYNINFYYTDTDSLYIERKNWNVLNKAKLVRSAFCEGKKDYGDDNFIFYGFF